MIVLPLEPLSPLPPPFEPDVPTRRTRIGRFLVGLFVLAAAFAFLAVAARFLFR